MHRRRADIEPPAPPAARRLDKKTFLRTDAATESGRAHPQHRMRQRSHTVSCDLRCRHSEHRIFPVSHTQCQDLKTSGMRFNGIQLDSLFTRRGEADDILIVRNGLLTDTSIANIALWDGRQWHTPTRPLLKGTRRAELLDNGILTEHDIPVEKIWTYRKIRLFNAMLHFGEIELPCADIQRPTAP